VEPDEPKWGTFEITAELANKKSLPHCIMLLQKLESPYTMASEELWSALLYRGQPHVAKELLW
jgi:hypothetical protein